jgi:hypothetical protein
MKLTSDNFEVMAAKAYRNEHCISTEEFLEDLAGHSLIKKLARKITKGSSKNLRLLTNHVICFTNNFEITFAKEALLLDSGMKESRVISAVLLYLGFLAKNEYTITSLDFETLKLLKDMDKNG